MNSIIRFLYHGLRSISLLLLGCYIVAGYADRISPLNSVLPAFVGLLYPLFFIPALLVTVYWCVRRAKFALVCIALFCFGSEAFFRYTPFNLRNGSTDDLSLKVMTYNTCGFGENRSRDAAKDMIAYIKQVDADVVCLQEFRSAKRHDGQTLQSIREQLKEYPYFCFTTPQASRLTGLATFSKYPIKSHRRLTFDSHYNHACLVEVVVDGQPVNILNTHLESNQLTLKDRAFYQDFILDFDTNKLDEVKNNLFVKLAKAFRKRAAQVDRMRELLDRLSDPIIVCGDLNDTPISYTYHRLRGDLQDAYVSKGLGPGITYYENFFLFRIDHVFHSHHFKTANVEIGNVTYSDHYPVIVTLNRAK